MRRSLLVGLMFAAGMRAETGYDAWLRYAPVKDTPLPAVVSVIGAKASGVPLSAQGEIVRGVRGMFGKTLRMEQGLPREDAILLGTLAEFRGPLHLAGDLAAESFWLRRVEVGGVRYTAVVGGDVRGELYGAFALLRRLGEGKPLAGLDERETPAAPIRWVNQWDNLDGSVERGYGGRSIFWADGHARADLQRVGDYGRLLASLGINGCTINNVNANPRMLEAAFVPEIARIADAFRPWGVRVSIAVDFGSPKSVGGLPTFDPLDPNVIAWWKARVDDLYRAVPDLAGFVLKADSEGRVGPGTYGRSHADAANLLARALRSHGGIVLYRGFVYNHHMDWRDPHNDRARAAFDNFQPLDGKFDENAVVQIKNGPIDFQVREPVSPLFGALHHTNVALELQVTQEYMGQGRSLVFLVPQWKEALGFDLRADGKPTTLKEIAAGKTFGRPLGGFAGVANVGLDDSWYGNHMSQANLYGFGRLAWNPDLSTEQIVDEWTRLTWGADAHVAETIRRMQLASWRTYENYTGPLGLQTLTDIVGNHFGVAVEASERNGWGQWHHADPQGVGMDRTMATGTGYAGQYAPDVAKVFESVTHCPDDLLLFFHHVPYTHVLLSGKTVIQSIYDSHYEGAAAVEHWVAEWKALQHSVDDQRWSEVLAQLQFQVGQAEEWRDAVNGWFFAESKITDTQGRVGHFPNRAEAEAMQLTGYRPVPVLPTEAVSGGQAVACEVAPCSADFAFSGTVGWYTVRVRYFDQNNGASHFRLLVGEQPVAEWTANNRLPTAKLDSTSSSLKAVEGVALRPGDRIRVEGFPDGAEAAALDYVEWVSSSAPTQ